LTRYYASSGVYASPGTERPNGILGPKWRHSWQSTLVVEDDGGDHAYVILPDGDYRHFEPDSGAWVGRADKADKLEEVVVSGVRTGWIFRRQDDSIYRYDDQGRWMTLERGGLVTTLIYSDASTSTTIAPGPGFLIAVTDAKGRTLSFRYDLDGFLIRVLDPAGGQYGYRYDAQQFGDFAPRNVGNLRYVDYPNATAREYRYDESGHVYAGAPNLGLLTGIIDENAQRYGTYEYDNLRRAFQEWHGSHGADLLSFAYTGTSTSYDAGTSSTRLTEPLGQTIRRKYTAVAGIVRDAGVDRCSDAACTSVEASSSKVYDANGVLLLETDFNGNTIGHVFDAKGRETQRTEASNDVTAKRTIVTEWNTSPIFNVPDKRPSRTRATRPSHRRSGRTTAAARRRCAASWIRRMRPPRPTRATTRQRPSRVRRSASG
jgi:YD repeat-containing protein